MSRTVNIELTPYQALSILKFLSEYEEEFKQVPQLASFNDVYKAYREQVCLKITDEDLEDATMETDIQQALGRDPLSPKNKGE